MRKKGGFCRNFLNGVGWGGNCVFLILEGCGG